MRTFRSHLKTLRDVVLAHTRGEHPDLASLAVELGRIVHRDGSAGLPAGPANDARAHRRVLLRRPSVQVLLLTWPANHMATPCQASAEWELMLSLRGAFELLPGAAEPGDGFRRAATRSWLGPGDAVWFDAGEPRLARSRNLSRRETALSLHVIGGKPDHWTPPLVAHAKQHDYDHAKRLSVALRADAI
jgi:hypothetical protein